MALVLIPKLIGFSSAFGDSTDHSLTVTSRFEQNIHLNRVIIEKTHYYLSCDRPDPLHLSFVSAKVFSKAQAALSKKKTV